MVTLPARHPVRAALRYYSGKARLASWIVVHFPLHVCSVEPFGGAASVLFRKPPGRYEVDNELDEELVGFFRVLRERPDDLLRAIERTPFARAEVDLAGAPTPHGVDSVERDLAAAPERVARAHGRPIDASERSDGGGTGETRDLAVTTDSPGTSRARHGAVTNRPRTVNRPRQRRSAQERSPTADGYQQAPLPASPNNAGAVGGRTETGAAHRGAVA